MAITFQSVIDNVMKELNAATINKLAPEDMVRYCVDAWHEIGHTGPFIRTEINASTGVLTDCADVAPDNSDASSSFPTAFDSRRSAIEAYVRRRVDMRSQLDRDQLARAKLDEFDFRDLQGIPQS